MTVNIEISDSFDPSVPFHLFCAGCVNLITRIWGHQIYGMANKLYDFDSDYVDKVKLNSSEDELVKDYVNQFEYYIGNIGSQVDSITKILGTPKVSFPKQISKWKKHYEGASSPALYQPPDEPKLFVDWWRKISKPIKIRGYDFDEEKGRIKGPRSLLMKNWDELKNEDKDKIRIAMEKISSYFEDYLSELNQLHLNKNRLASKRLPLIESMSGSPVLKTDWARLNELHISLNIEYPNLETS
ncbi:MAG: hypothetical protein CL758_06530 [Chloroflexi bacterium]|nr:hypothetical protein [Chloroflexota bacterium]|tara:strand:+ start:5409 stop:6134 length:726 start_codon:yes stop_codon:yes gene_type:complete